MIQADVLNQLHVVNIFARGGGGGSGGGGGGGGLGGGGGSALFLAGYVPTHLAGAFFRKQLNNPIGLAMTAILTVGYAGIFFALGGIWIIVGLCALIGGPAGFFNWFGKVSMLTRKKAANEVAKAAANDPAWDMDALKQQVQSVYMTFQKDWGTFNTTSMKTYLSAEYFNHIELMMAAIKLRQRRNATDNPQLLEAFPVSVEDFEDNTQDKVTFYIHGKMQDKIIESIDGNETQLYESDADFYEYWHFIRSGKAWLLDGISQATENAFSLRSPIREFAAKNGMYYSPDWGWLLLPNRGILFKDGDFGISDINNHVIGIYKNVLIELYSYIPNPRGSGQGAKEYVVAQAALPKRYDSLIVQAREPWYNDLLKKTPKGYNKLSLEWPDFNKRYVVYATNVEQVTAFELLHPVYMEKLFALPFKVSIEVVDNVVYLYSHDAKADYGMMYAILKDAFEEMKL